MIFATFKYIAQLSYFSPNVPLCYYFIYYSYFIFNSLIRLINDKSCINLIVELINYFILFYFYPYYIFSIFLTQKFILKIPCIYYIFIFIIKIALLYN